MGSGNWQEIAAIAIVAGVGAGVLWRWWRRRSTKTAASACGGCSSAATDDKDTTSKEATLRFHRRKH
jgi:ABC-type nickel/cobalt efflux system permease component RcnA